MSSPISPVKLPKTIEESVTSPGSSSGTGVIPPTPHSSPRGSLDLTEAMAIRDQVAPPSAPPPLDDVFNYVVEDKATTAITTPSLAERQTAKLRFPNGLQALVISDPGRQQSGASLAVNIGSFSDPEDGAGIAHFTEHLLFMGTKKYPSQNGYTEHLAEYNGTHNAYTANDQTVYTFACDHKGFDKTLDMLSHFFKTATFDPTSVEDELNAIDNEFSKNKDSDAWHLLHVKKMFANPEHPYHLFNIGNKETLKTMDPQRVKEWYQQNYSSHLMNLVIQSNQPLDVLCQKAYESFGDIPKTDSKPYSDTIPMISPKAKGHFIHVQPQKEMRRVTLSWGLPPAFANQIDSAPDHLVAHILGDEGSTSLLQHLKDSGLASDLWSGGRDEGPGNNVFQISIGLTEEGLLQLETVIERCFQAIADLRETGISSALFEDIKKLSLFEYQNQTRQPLFENIQGQASLMSKEPLETYPERLLIRQHYDSELIQDYVAQLKPSECVYYVQHKPEGYEFKERDNWMDTPYQADAIDPSTMSAWEAAVPHPDIRVMEANPFVTEEKTIQHPTVKGKGLVTPTLIEESESARVHFAGDTRFGTPTLHYEFDIKTPSVIPSDTKTQVLVELLAHYHTQVLNPVLYQAASAGLRCGLNTLTNGLKMTVSGFSGCASLGMDALIGQLKKDIDSEEIFKLCQSELRRSYANYYTTQPTGHAMENVSALIRENYSKRSEKAEAIADLSLKDLHEFAKTFFAKTYIEATLFGNVTEEQAKAHWQKVHTGLSGTPYSKELRQPSRVATLPEKALLQVTELTQSEDNVAILLVDNGPSDIESRAAHMVVTQGLKEPFFNELRTKQQTGYICGSAGQEIEKHLYSYFIVQSPTHQPEYLISEYQKFLASFVEDFNQEQLLGIRDSLVRKIEHGPENTRAMCSKLHGIAVDHDADFDYNDKVVAALKGLDGEALKRYATKFFVDRGEAAISLHGSQNRLAASKELCEYV